MAEEQDQRRVLREVETSTDIMDPTTEEEGGEAVTGDTIIEAIDEGRIARTEEPGRLGRKETKMILYEIRCFIRLQTLVRKCCFARSFSKSLITVLLLLQQFQFYSKGPFLFISSLDDDESFTH